MTLLRSIIRNYNNPDVNNLIEEIQDLVTSCIPDTSVPKSFEYGQGVGDFCQKLNEKGLLII
jgi:hypothetical protein